MTRRSGPRVEKPKTMSDQPKCVEVSDTVSVGGKIQIVKYEVDQTYFYSFTRKYEIPEGWNERDVEDFQLTKAAELRDQLEPLAQAEVDALLEQKADLA